MIERRLQYNYVQIDLETGECIGCITTSYEITMEGFMQIPSTSSEYIGKYYLNGSWYEDAEGTIPWTPPV